MPRWVVSEKSLAIFLLVACVGNCAEPNLAEPWSVSSLHPVTCDLSPGHGQSALDVPGIGPSILGSWIRFYQRHMHAVTASRCIMLPSCSQYSLEAIRRYGVIIGIIMTMDRFIHEWDEPKHAPLVKVDGKLRCFDPVEANIFWRH